MVNSAAIICTRNRSDPLRDTLASIADQDFSPLPLVIVVDGSDDPIYSQNEAAIADISSLSVNHHRYDGPPSAGRQRNIGLQQLPDSTETVFFFDDDITLRTDCLRSLANALNSSTDLRGVGGREVFLDDQSNLRSSSRSQFWKYLFLLDHPKPGRVLPSGRVSPYFSLSSHEQLVSTEWLSTCCCAYERSIFDNVQFSESLSGAMLEDLDLSYQVAKQSSLAVVPWATFIHHRSPLSRRSTRRFSRDRIIQRYWFLERRIDHPLQTVAFWWAILGQLLAALVSPKKTKWEGLQGLLDGIRSILTRSHPLLRK